jgi:hypothetical protein
VKLSFSFSSSIDELILTDFNTIGAISQIRLGESTSKNATMKAPAPPVVASLAEDVAKMTLLSREMNTPTIAEIITNLPAMFMNCYRLTSRPATIGDHKATKMVVDKIRKLVTRRTGQKIKEWKILVTVRKTGIEDPNELCHL